MANEIKYNLSVTLANTGLTDSYSTAGLTADQSTSKLVRNVQLISVSDANGHELSLGGVTSQGLAVFANL